MIKILSSRGTGRSYQIARYAIENNCNILVAYYSGVKYMRAILDDIFKSDGYVIDKQDGSDDGYSYYYIFRRRFETEQHTVKIYSANDAIRFKELSRDENIVIDDADRVLEYLFRPYKLKGITMEIGNN
jgi:hypothetical protein